MPPKMGRQNKRSGRMTKKGGQFVLQEEINNDEDWTKMIEKPGFYVVDVYTEWCGPCVPMIANLKKLKMELGNENLHYAIAKSDYITVLERFRQKSQPHWLFFFDGNLVNLIVDANAPRLIKLIMEEAEQYDKFKKGEIQRDFIPITTVTEEERQKSIEKDNYEKQKTKKAKKLRDERMLKVREHALNKFSVDVQMQSCVMFFPHTVEYVMVEKPPSEGGEEPEESRESATVQKRVCEVANSCALKYEELIVVEAKEVQLTEDTLNEVFFADKEFLKSLPQELIDQLLSRKVFSVMLSLPTVKQDEVSVVDEENPPEPFEYMGLVEQKLSMIIYGNGDPLSPSPESLAAKHALINDSGKVTPSLYTPTNPLSKASALVVLFQKFCKNNGYVPPQPPPPQYLVVFDLNKSNVVLPIIEELDKKIIYYGFFRSADPANPRLLCKDPELLITYGVDRVGKDAKLVLSVMKDEKDRSLLRFVDVGPIYVSPDHEMGIDEANKFFPHDFEEIDGEIKTWLVQQSIREEEMAKGECAVEECGEEQLEEGNNNSPDVNQQQQQQQQ